MFTGIIAAVGEISRIETSNDSARLTIGAGGLDLDDVQLGDSIAVSGPCLTVVEFDANTFKVDVSSETLAHTSLGSKRQGTRVNLEKALRLSDRLGGHLVSGHVDGLGTITERTALEDYVRFAIEAPGDIAKYIAHKGSVAVDGVSLTVNAVSGDVFELMIIPHTLRETTLGDLKRGDSVNLEVDLLARYLERLHEHQESGNSEISRASLSDAGFGRN